MITFNTNKLNLRLIRARMYLSQFKLNVRHKSERDHVILDALSRLSFFDVDDEKFTENHYNNTLDDIEAYVKTLMKIFTAFKNRLVQIYKTNKQ